MGDIVDDLRSAAYVSPPRDADDYSKMVSCGLLLRAAQEIEHLRNAVADEREACARIADDHSAWARSFGAEEACEMVAKAIRSR